MSVAMAFLLLASTTSWTVEKHYCMGHLVDMAFFGHAETCGMEMDSSDDFDSEVKDEKSCCSDEIIAMDGQDDLKISFNDISLDQQLFLVAFTHSYLNLFQELEGQAVPHKQYPPPTLVKDIHVLDQVFLI